MTTMTRVLSTFLLLTLAALAPACGRDSGDDDDDDDGGGSCASAGRAICAAACDCRPGDGCAITDETASATISFDTQEDCEALYVGLGCTGGGDQTIDFGQCQADVEAAACAGDGDEAGVVGPASCEGED
jgi:hypothetical protein